MAQSMDPHELSRSLTGEDLKNFFKKGIISSGLGKTIDVDQASTKSEKVGTSKVDASSNLDEILVSETCEILDRAAKEISSCSGKIDRDTMDMVVEIFVNRVSDLLRKISEFESNDSFSCTFCWELLHDPITLRCGHTFCRSCLSSYHKCKECKTEIDWESRHSGNVLLTTILQKLFSMNYVVRALTVEGNECAKKSCYEKAVSKYTDAKEFGIPSVQATLGRAKAFQALGNAECAVEDAMSAPTFKKNSHESLMTKGEILFEQNRDVESLMCFLSCLAIEPTSTRPMDYTKKVLHKLLSKNLPLFDPSGKRRKFSESALSAIESQESNMVLETLLCCLLREIDNSLLSDVNLDKYLQNEGKRKKEELSNERKFDKNLVNPSDFECSLCMMLFFNPVCTPCGHSFCRDCLERSMDHGSECPLCKRSLPLNFEKKKVLAPPLDMCLASIIRQVLPSEYQERLEIHEKEIETLRSSTPIFVCTIAYPTMPCPLHIFEPKYRLLLRRAIDIHDGKFGIGVPATDKPFQEFGTMVKLRNVSFFPDGRSVVESEGFSRFKTISSGVRDGYHIAEVEYLVDCPIMCQKELALIEKLSQLVYEKSKAWYLGVDETCKESIRMHFKDFPERDTDMGANGPHWLWWVLAVLPVQDQIKVSLLGKTELKQRLLIVNKILNLLRKPADT